MSCRSKKAFVSSAASASCHSDKESEELFAISLHASADRNGSSAKSYSHVPTKKQKRNLKLFCSTKACPFYESIVGFPSNSAQEKVGVLLLNLGGPETLRDVQPFLFNLFTDPGMVATLVLKLGAAPANFRSQIGDDSYCCTGFRKPCAPAGPRPE